MPSIFDIQHSPVPVFPPNSSFPIPNSSFPPFNIEHSTFSIQHSPVFPFSFLIFNFSFFISSPTSPISSRLLSLLQIFYRWPAPVYNLQGPVLFYPGLHNNALSSTRHRHWCLQR